VRRTPTLVAAAFGLAVAIAILVSGPLLLFNPWFVSVEQGRHGVPAALGIPASDVDRMTGSLVGDLFTGGSFEVAVEAGTPFLDETERSHMTDVGRLVQGLAMLDLLALGTVLLAGRRLRGEPGRRARLLLAGAASVGAAAVALGLFFAVAFDAAFTAFHNLFFAPGTWQFGLGSHLIGLFPEPFWFEASLAAGASIVLAALLAAWLARRDLRRAASPAG